MSTIQFKEANCRNCYKCLRGCLVKAISFKNGQAEIIEDECILCGNCLTVCPQHAKTINNYVDAVKKMIQKNEKIFVSLAPSFITSFDQGRSWVYAALRKLGFARVEETSVGALQVSKQYEKLMNQKKMKNIITTACPSVVLLIEKHYPELIPQMAPVVSPMVAHARMLRKTYGNKIKVVFIGPCISKIEEYKDFQNEGAIDAVITFEELWRWITSEGIDQSISTADEIEAMNENIAKIYPIPGGILRTINKKSKKNYNCISVDGTGKCIEILDSIHNNGLQNYFIEMNSCTDGCIGGPYRRKLPGGFLESRRKLLDYVKAGLKEDSGIKVKEEEDIAFGKTFTSKFRKPDIPSESVVQGILNSIGKFSEEDELNCSACGYTSCREKAVAVYQEKAQLYMCLPYMRERAESMSNLIINTTPDAIIALDKKLQIQEFNRSARDMFHLNSVNPEGKSIHDILDCEDFDRVLKRKENIYNKKHFYEKYKMTVEQTIIYIEKQNMAVIIIKDISGEEQRRRELFEMRKATVDVAQSVIDKQMRVAQEIASLLGETTAETKVILTRLQKTMMAEMSEEE